MSNHPLAEEIAAEIERLSLRVRRSLDLMLHELAAVSDALRRFAEAQQAQQEARRAEPRGGYASPPEPVYTLPPVPDGPAPGALPGYQARDMWGGCRNCPAHATEHVNGACPYRPDPGLIGNAEGDRRQQARDVAAAEVCVAGMGAACAHCADVVRAGGYAIPTTAPDPTITIPLAGAPRRRRRKDRT